MSDSPPQIESVLIDQLGRIKHAKGSKYLDSVTPQLTGSAREAVSWFLRVMEPPSRFEAVRAIRGRNKDGEEKITWQTPYHGRMTYLLTRFCSEPVEYQELIIAAAEDGIWWRGDSRPMFERVIKHTARFRQLGEHEYQKRAQLMMAEICKSKGETKG